jgi:UDP-N-acetylmuramoyl-L-alanyl-D-glutamate--2,6-diaminopimelate ligase
MGPISAAFYGTAGGQMTVAGVTGTNGKTTTTYLLEAVFRADGRTPGVVGTTGVRIDGRPQPFPRTTPEAPDLQRLFAEMAREGVDAVAMEVSSHGLDQHRVDGVRYAVAVFTNLSQDHLDYHASMEEYFSAKARLFTAGDERARGREPRQRRGPPPRRLRTADDHVRRRARCGRPGDRVETTADGVAFEVDGVAIRSALRGSFNVENCLAAFATAAALGIDAEVAADAISASGASPGGSRRSRRGSRSW